MSIIQTTMYSDAAAMGKPFWWIVAAGDGGGAITDQITRADGCIILFACYDDALMTAIEANDDGECAVARGDLSSWDTMYPVPVRLDHRGGAWQVAPLHLHHDAASSYAMPCYRNCEE